MENLKDLIEQGIAYEDDFIATYLDVLNSPDYIQYFAENEEKANALINTLIKESRLHRNSLVNIINSL